VNLKTKLKTLNHNFHHIKEDIDMPDFEEMRNAMNRATQDDIVTRLRIEKQNCLLMNNGNPFLMQDVIDEIESLRSQVKAGDLQIDALLKLVDSMGKRLYGDD
jgi:hypothetical protein